MSDCRTIMISNKSYGKSVEYIKWVLSKFDPNIHEKIVIEVVPCEKIKKLEARIKELKEALHLATIKICDQGSEIKIMRGEK